MNTERLDALLERGEALLERLEHWLPPPPPEPDWDAPAFRWRRRGAGGYLETVPTPHRIRLSELRNIDRQRELLERNTRQFLAGLPANNALLWGSRGTGKSSLIKALLTEYAADGLRLIEVEKQDLAELPTIIEPLRDRPERFVLFCDDLSFEADDPSYKTLKAVLDGSVSAAPDNVLIYATSNRRHLLPEYMSDNQKTQVVEGELHHGEAVEEKISLSERFGLWLSFHPFDQDAYLRVVYTWLEQLGVDAERESEAIRADALRFALERGSRSGRVAWQFARDYAGRRQLAEAERGN